MILVPQVDQLDSVFSLEAYQDITHVNGYFRKLFCSQLADVVSGFNTSVIWVSYNLVFQEHERDCSKTMFPESTLICNEENALGTYWIGR
jgi:hypothetical protein